MTDENEHSTNYSPLKQPGERVVAVAIKGVESGKADSTPNVIASGRGKLAEDILKLAFDRGIKVREDADLAEILVMLDLDTPIPSEAIVAVAEILAKVYEVNGQKLKAAAPTLDSDQA